MTNIFLVNNNFSPPAATTKLSSKMSSGGGGEQQNVRKEEVFKLMDKRKEMESELCLMMDLLKSQGVGMDEALVDEEGFPRNDIDVHQVRIARNKIICLRNDLKAIMGEIERGLHNLHAQSLEGIGVHQPISPTSAAAAVLPSTFARVDLVSPGSPAERAGLLAGDAVAEFGSIKADNFAGLKSLAELAQNSQDHEVSVRVVREGRLKQLTLTPKTWSGQGLLGCKLVPTEPILDR